MYTTLLHIHSVLRYVVLVFLLIVIVRSLMGWISNKPYGAKDNQFSLFLLIVTHIQFIAGLLLYFVSPFVQFGPTTMKDASTRYWSVEHISMMIVAVALITVARVSHKKLTTDLAKHKRLFIHNALALFIIIITVFLSGRGLLSMTS